MTRGEKSVEELRSGWKNLQQEVRSRGKSMEVCCSSCRQTLSLDPIASQSLNRETSATRLVRDLFVKCKSPCSSRGVVGRLILEEPLGSGTHVHLYKIRICSSAQDLAYYKIRSLPQYKVLTYLD